MSRSESDRHRQESQWLHVKDRIKYPVTTGSLTVDSVGRYFFDWMENKLPENTVNVDMDEWVETDGTKFILNGGAWPCTIIFLADRETGRVLSGHFSAISPKDVNESAVDYMEKKKKEYLRKNKSESLVRSATKQEIQTFSRSLIDEGFENYLKAKKRMAEWVRDSGADNLDAFLFGTNYSGDVYGDDREKFASALTRSAIDQHTVAFQLYELGIPYANQHDFRIPGLQYSADNTLYHPEKQTIYHHRDFDPDM